MTERKEIHTFCGVCGCSCAVVAEVVDGKLVSVKADKSRGYRHAICPGAKGPLTLIGVENHPDRLKHPLKRVGKRGEGKWEEISWDEALDITAEKLLDVKEKFGPEYVALCMGEPKNMETIFAHRFATVFGTPNVITPGGLCGVPHIRSDMFTYGNVIMPDCPEEYTEGRALPRLIVGWGVNLNRNPGRHFLKMFRDHGAKVVIIDPMKKSAKSQKADLWIRPRPGSDGALAAGILKVVIEEELYEKDIVERWTIGFERVREEMSTFSLDEVERLTWVPKEQVQEVARLYATIKPACLQIGNAIECMKNCLDIIRVSAILRSITGNLNVPGGEVFLTAPPHTRPGRAMLLSKYGRRDDLSLAREFPIAIRDVYIPYQCLVKSLLEGKPYRIKAMVTCLSNPLMSFPDSDATYRGLMNLDFHVILELFHTPTTAIADIVLPAAWTWEDDTIGYWWIGLEEVRGYPKVVDPPGEAWTDTKIFNELAKKMGMGADFFEDDKEALDLLLEGSGIKFNELLEKGKLLPTRLYKTPEEKGGYRTPSGKIELYSETMEKMGCGGMPTWKALSRLPGEVSEAYPLVLADVKEDMYMLTGFKMIDGLRKKVPDPIVRLNPETAQKLGMSDGDWIYIETKKGKISQKLSVDPDLDPRIVLAAWGWWFPEEGIETGYGWRRANYNILMEHEEPAQPFGNPDFKGIPCRVYKA